MLLNRSHCADVYSPHPGIGNHKRHMKVILLTMCIVMLLVPKASWLFEMKSAQDQENDRRNQGEMGPKGCRSYISPRSCFDRNSHCSRFLLEHVRNHLKGGLEYSKHD